MILKKVKKSFQIFAVLLFSMPYMVYAYSDYIIASGKNIGIEIKPKGVLVVGTYAVNGDKIALLSDIRIGDKIIKVNSKDITSINELTNNIDANSCNDLKISYERSNKIYDTTLKLGLENGICKTGLYVKDSVIGIGTLTFIDPNTKLFGTLGHEIAERTTGDIIETNNGTIFNSEVISIEKSRNGTPGEKNAKYYSKEVNGKIFENTKQGIFGEYTNLLPKQKLYKVAKPNEIKKGNAIIKTVLSGTEVKEYGITITKLVDNQDTKNIYFDITDEKLLDITGGIIQGMSGSPIIQGDYIIGAVTHVVVDNPTKGYGIYITNMLEQAEK